MKPTQLLDAFRNIRKEIVAFISIVMIGLLAAVAYLGIVYAAATLKKDALGFFNSHELWDIEVTSTMLFTDEDLDVIRAVPGVREAEHVYQVDTRLRIGDSNTAVSVVSLPDKISLPILFDGRLPEATNECAVEKKLADDCGLAVGQRITLKCDEIMGADPLTESSFVITGVFHTPDHFSYMVPVTQYILVREDCFNREGLDGAFMKVRIRVAGTPEDRYSDDYKDIVKHVTDALETLGSERAPARTAQIRGSYEDTVREGEEELEEARETLREAQQKIDDTRRELADAEAQLGDMKASIDNAEAALNEAEEELENARKKAEELFPSSLPDFVSDRLNAEEELLREMRDSWYYSGEEYLDAVTLYNNGKKKLEEAERELADGEEQLRDAESKLREAKENLEELGSCNWVVIDNYGNPGFIYAAENFDKLSSLCMSFSTIFLVVGALVIYATISRMVEQHRRLIGVNKALGLYNREIFAKYLIFACGAVMLGVGLGILLAWLPVQRAILSSYEVHLNYGTGSRSFLLFETGVVAVGAFAISLVAVYLGCSQLLRQTALVLMSGAKPGSTGKKKSRSSATKSLYFRLILRNMLTDRNRVMVTIVSIAGGCVLMVVGFTLRYGISGVPDRQYGEILTYDAEVIYETGDNTDAASEIERLLDQNALQHIVLCKKDIVFEADETLNSLTLITAEKGSLDGYFALNDIDRGDRIDLPESGALVPRRFWEFYGIGVGEMVPVYDAGMNSYEISVAGVFENYYGQLFFLTPHGYEEIFGSAPEDNCFYVKTGGMPLSDLQKLLNGIEGLVRVNDAAADRDMIEQFTSSLNFVVYFMLFIAGMMACFIVANFTVTFIQRKTGELTIMRINGFTSGECIRYVAVDLIATTVLGTVVGLAIGGIMGSRILGVTETSYIQMIREPNPRSFLFSLLVTFGFSALTNSFALRRIHNLKLTDINS